MAKDESAELYDEPMTDQDPREPDTEKDEGSYQTFLAPKAAFAGKSLEIGAVHRVRIERVLDEELELKCIEKGGREEPEMNEETNELYE